MPELVRAAAAAFGDAPAVVLRDDDKPEQSITFAQLDARSSELGRALVAMGAGKGARIGFICGNGPDFALYLAAIARIGAVAVPISTMIRANELVRVLRRSDVAGLLVQRSLLGKDLVERLCDALPGLADAGAGDLRLPQVPFLRWIASSGEGLPASIRQLSDVLALAETVGEDLLEEIEREVHTTDQLVEIYTSGSMALPKGVRHNHGPVLARTHFLRRMIGIKQGEEKHAILPMFWVGGLMMYLMADWSAGATTTCGERTLSNSRMAMGAVLSPDDLELMSRQPKPWWGLGMSETLGPYSYGDEFRAPGYPVCAPIDNIADDFDIRIADENDQPVGDGEVGEMQVRGYAVTPGLHKIEREGYFTPDGYYHTGDMCLVEGKRIHFVGRNGDMIKTAGSNVSPSEVEMELQAIEGVHNAYVVGIPDPERGQLVVAAVVPREGATLDFQRIEAELRQRLSSYKVPRRYVGMAREEVPMLHSNKVARREIEKLMIELFSREDTGAPA